MKMGSFIFNMSANAPLRRKRAYHVLRVENHLCPESVLYVKLSPVLWYQGLVSNGMQQLIGG